MCRRLPAGTCSLANKSLLAATNSAHCCVQLLIVVGTMRVLLGLANERTFIKRLDAFRITLPSVHAHVAGCTERLSSWL